MTRPRLVVGILLGSALTVLPIAHARTQAPAADGVAAANRTAFLDVPKGSPLYQAAVGLEQAGVFTGYPDGTVGGRRALTRYEFAVAIQRMLQTLRRAVGEVEKGQFHPLMERPREQAPNARTRAAALLATFQDGEKLTLAFTRLQTLVTEFGSELKLLGQDPEQARKEIAGWLQKVGKLSDQAKALKAPQTSRKRPDEKK